MIEHPPHRRFACRALLAASLAAGLASCASPLQQSREAQLRDAVIGQQRRQLQAVAAGPIIEVSRPPSSVEKELSPKRRAQLDSISGVSAYQDLPLNLGEDLLGKTKAQAVEISLDRAIGLAVQHNLDLAVARLGPAIAQTQVTQAQAAFDAVFFTTADWSKLDTPRPPGSVTGLAGNQTQNNLSVAAGVRKNLYSGGQLTVQTQIARNEQKPTFFAVPSYYDADVLVSLTQPLLRGFGRDVTRANILLARNAKLSQVEQLHENMLTLAFNVEQAYWNLVLAKQQLLIQQRLLQRTLDDRDRLVARRHFDVSSVQVTEANSFVELQRSDLIRARRQLREASDQLKLLINAPDLAVSGETLLLPVEKPVEAPIKFSLLDAVTTALQRRPEMHTKLLSIKDASIRQRVADNARLPLLTLGASLGLNGVDSSSAADAYGELGKFNYIDYLLSGQFEVPIGNRGPEAFYTQRRLERRQAVLAYRKQARDVVLDVKNALRTVLTSYQLIGATRSARRAAADNLRAIQAQEDAGAALTPQFLLDQKLQAQQRLADAETQEIQATINYNIAIAKYYQAVGSLLERDGIAFKGGDGELQK